MHRARCGWVSGVGVTFFWPTCRFGATDPDRCRWGVMTTPETSFDHLAWKEAELREQRRLGMPLTILLGVLGAITAVSAGGDALLGLGGVHMITAPMMIVLILVRLPRTRRMAGLAKELQELRQAKRVG
jgi:hypothetical protein